MTTSNGLRRFVLASSVTLIAFRPPMASAQAVFSDTNSAILSYAPGNGSRNGYEKAGSFVNYYFANCLGASVQVFVRWHELHFQAQPIYWFKGKRLQVPQPYAGDYQRLMHPVDFITNVNGRQMTLRVEREAVGPCVSWKNVMPAAELWTEKASIAEKKAALARLTVSNGQTPKPLINEELEKYFWQQEYTAAQAASAERARKDAAARTTATPTSTTAPPTPVSSQPTRSGSVSGGDQRTPAQRYRDSVDAVLREQLEESKRQADTRAAAQAEQVEAIGQGIQIVGSAVGGWLDARQKRKDQEAAADAARTAKYEAERQARYASQRKYVEGESNRHYASAMAGDTTAQMELANAYLRSQLPGYAQPALQMYGRAAAQGHVGAMLAIGVLHYYGSGTELRKSYPDAVKWIKTAWQRDSASAASLSYVLADMYASGGNGLQQDVLEAEKWYRRVLKTPGLEHYRDQVYQGLRTIAPDLQAAREVEPYVGIGIRGARRNGKLVVGDVVAGSPASTAGIRPGEEIRSVDGVAADAWHPVKLREVERGEAGAMVTLGLNRTSGDIVRLQRARVMPTAALPLHRSDVKGRVRSSRFFAVDASSLAGPMESRQYASSFQDTVPWVAHELTIGVSASPQARLVEVTCTRIRESQYLPTYVTRSTAFVLPGETEATFEYMYGSRTAKQRAGRRVETCTSGGRKIGDEKKFAIVQTALPLSQVGNGTSRAERVAALIGATRDSGVQTVAAEIVGIRFYEKGNGQPIPGILSFRTQFDSATTRYVGVVLDFAMPRTTVARPGKFVCQRLGPDGGAWSQEVATFSIDTGWTRMSWAPRAMGWSQPGPWTPGRYSIDCYSGGVLIASGGFSIERKNPPPIASDAFVRADSLYWRADTALRAKDGGRALPLLRDAVALGHPAAGVRLASMYRDGSGVAADTVMAMQLYRRFAELGDPVSQYSLAMQYRYGVSIARDSVQEVRWLRASAAQGVAASQRELARKLAGGYGVQPDTAEATRLFRLAAAQGDAASLYEVALAAANRGASGFDDAIRLLEQVTRIAGRELADRAAERATNLRTRRETAGRIGVTTFAVDGAVQVSMVAPGGAAHAAGMRPLDRILTIDGRSVSGLSTDSIWSLTRGRIGSTVTVTVARSGARQPLTLTMTRGESGAMPESSLGAAGGRVVSMRFYSQKERNGLPEPGTFATSFASTAGRIAVEVVVEVRPLATEGRLFPLECDLIFPGGARTNAWGSVLVHPGQSGASDIVHLYRETDDWPKGAYSLSCKSGGATVATGTFGVI